MNSYLYNLASNETYPELLAYASNFNVPIIQPEAKALIISYLRLMGEVRILEIGCAIGYSALSFASVNPKNTIDTIERDPNMIELSSRNFEIYDKNHQIILHKGDALELDLKLLQPSYDVIFIDAGKAQSQRFFERYQGLLRKGGLIITDNILFHGLVEHPEEAKTKNLQSLIKKIDNYNRWLTTLPNYQTTFLSVGDGLAISQKVTE